MLSSATSGNAQIYGEDTRHTCNMISFPFQTNGYFIALPCPLSPSQHNSLETSLAGQIKVNH